MAEHDTPARVRWARLRFSIIGPLLASPPEAGQLSEQLVALAGRSWRHPTTGEAMRFSAKTIERWYYLARGQDDPVRALERKVNKQAGTHPRVTAKLAEQLVMQYRDNQRWSYQLHYDNLGVLAQEDPSLGPMPSYATVCRYMKEQGLLRQKKGCRRPEQQPARVARETRSYEVSHVHGLWHLDFHDGSRKVLCASGEWKRPVLLGILDDASRLCCHAQWYLEEDAEALVHGLSQAIQKRGLPRALLTDNGGAMLAAETVEGLERLGIVHETTLPRTPEQNGKQEVFWAQVEGRLLAMLGGEKELTLRLLNEATQAWVEQEYNRTVHRELKQSPLERYLQGRSVQRPSPDSETLRRAFRMEVTRTQRKSDGTLTVEGVRFEVPSAYRALGQVRLRVARWDLSRLDMVDPRTGVHLCTLLPLDKTKNADRVRRALAPPTAPLDEPPRQAGMAPLLRSLMADYAATGLPPGYLPKDELDTAPGPQPQGLVTAALQAVPSLAEEPQ
jgi:putative transposase